MTTTHRTAHRTVAASLLAVFTVVVDNTKVNVALPTLAYTFGADETTLQWVVESYVLAFAALLLLGGAITDRFGPTATMRVGLLGFTAGSILAATAPSVGMLVAARVLTGLAAALVMPATLAALVSTAPHGRSRAVAGWTGVVALGVATGPVLGGTLLAVAGWPSLFWLNTLLALGVVAALPRPTRQPTPDAAQLDVRGSVLLAGVMLGVVTAITEAPRHPWLIIPACAGVLLCAAAYARHQRLADPVLPLAIFHSGALRVSAGALSAMFAAIFGVAFLLPQYLQVVRSAGPLQSGFYILAYAIGLLVAAIAAGAVPARHRRLLVTSGLAVAAGVHAAAAVGLTSATSAWALTLGLAAVGVGVGCAQTPLTELLLGAIGPRTGLGSALNDAVREVAGVVGVALFGAVAVAFAGPAATTSALLDGIRAAAAVAAALLAIAAAATARTKAFAPPGDGSPR